MSAEDRNPFDDVSTIARFRVRATSAAEACFSFTAIQGPDQGLRFTVDGSQPCPALVGHGPTCNVRLTDLEASRRHATLELVGARVRITDLGSTNGTVVNGAAILDAFLKGGETLQIGSTVFAVERRDSENVAPLPATTHFGRVVGASTEMRRLYPLCERLAAAQVPLVIEGETGTGKEVLAEALHERGPRAAAPFIVFDCTAVVPTLVESELFGHERGAFTGATAPRKGVFEQADGGTLLIDEIGDLEASLQPKLLRAIERSEVRRVGGDRAIHVDVRLIAATRRDLDREVAAGRFRDDLYHRLAVGRIQLPPLRRRTGDVPLLVQHFCSQLGAAEDAIPNRILTQWEDDPWPGNVRQLRNAVARYLACGDLATALAPSEAGDDASAAAGDFITSLLKLNLRFSEARERVLDEFERRYIGQVLAQHDNNVSRAAEASGVARRYFHILKARTSKPK